MASYIALASDTNNFTDHHISYEHKLMRNFLRQGKMVNLCASFIYFKFDVTTLK